MVNGRRSTSKPSAPTDDHHNNRMWWFIKEIDGNIFVTKKSGRVKLDKKPLGAVKSISPSKNKPDVLKVISIFDTITIIRSAS